MDKPLGILRLGRKWGARPTSAANLATPASSRQRSTTRNGSKKSRYTSSPCSSSKVKCRPTCWPAWSPLRRSRSHGWPRGRGACTTGVLAGLRAGPRAAKYRAVPQAPALHLSGVSIGVARAQQRGCIAWRRAAATTAARANRRRLQHESTAANMQSDQKEQASDQKQWEAMRLHLDKALDSLSEKYRSILTACYLEGMSHAQASKALGIPERSPRLSPRVTLGMDEFTRSTSSRIRDSMIGDQHRRLRPQPAANG